MMWIIPLLLIVVGYVIFIIVRNSNTTGVKYMLLGISLILVGGIVAVDANSNFGGFEYLIVLIGLILSVVGFGKNN